MKLLSDPEFRQLAATFGFGPSPEYPSSDHWVSLRTELELRRYWAYPDEAGAPAFARALLEAGGPAETYWIRPSRGDWFDRLRPGEGWSSVWDTLVLAYGVPSGHVGAVGLSSQDPRLEAFLSLQLIMGTSLISDAVVLPSHGHHLWFFEHHDVVWAEFSDEETLATHIASLRAAGYELPSEPPDDTFKPQGWHV